MMTMSKNALLNPSVLVLTIATITTIIVPILSPCEASAAVSKPNLAGSSAPKVILLSATKEALARPLNDRLETLGQQGEQGYRNLMAIMFDATYPMHTRWRAVTAIGRIGGKNAIPELESALRSPDWFMRNAGLVAMAGVDRAAAIRWARKLLSDKALVVRAAAVEMIADLHDTASAPLLWEKLYAKENFRNKQSLFIRRRIVEALSMFKLSGTESRFVEILADRDQSLHPLAILALERMTDSTLGSDKDPIAFKRERWQKWWAERAERFDNAERASSVKL